MSISVPPTGFYIEVDTPGGNVRRLTPGPEAEFLPTLNGLPELEVPVDDADYWTSTDWQRQPMRAWLDGTRLPIEQVSEVRETPGGAELVGRGGVDLRQKFRKEYSDETAHNVIRDAVGSTPYNKTVDAAPEDTNKLITTWSGTGEFDANLHPDQDPALVDTSGNEFKPVQTCYLTAPQDIDTVTSNSSDNWTASEAVKITVDDSPNTTKVSWTVDLDYTIADGDWDIYLRGSKDWEGRVALEDGNGNQLGEEFHSSKKGGGKSVEWIEFTDKSNIDLSSGTLNINLITDSGGGNTADGNFYLDCAAVPYDNRYWDGSNFVNSIAGPQNLLDGGPPGLYAPIDIDFLVNPVLRAAGGRVEGSFNSTVNSQAIGIAPKISGSFNTGSNTTAHEADFGSTTDDWVARITLGGRDQTTEDITIESSVTEHRTEVQKCTDLTLKYDAFKSPTVAQPVENRVIDILNRWTDAGNLLWEVQYNSATDSIEIVVTGAGQRTSDADPDLIDYKVEKNIGKEVSEVKIIGRGNQETEETFTADPGGTQLDNDNIKRFSERVYSGSTEFVRGEDEDYTMNYLSGQISAGDAQSSMTDGNDYNIDYVWTAQDSDAQSGTGATFFNEVVREIPSLRTDSECKQAARFAVDALDGPQWRATVRIPRQSVGFDLIDEISPSRLPEPADGGYEVRSIDKQADVVVLTLGSGPSIGDVVAQIRSSIGQTAREV